MTYNLCRHSPCLLLCLVFRVQSLIVGVFNGEGPPVPIPNTEVKLTSADNTCLETDRKDRSTPTLEDSFAVLLYASLAQSVEHAAVNRGVVGSSPTRGATFVHGIAVTNIVAAIILLNVGP